MFVWILLTLNCAWAINGLDNAGPIVTLPEAGQLQGSTATSAWTGRIIYQFLSIPYAQTTSASGRFKPPREVEEWEGVKDVTVAKTGCPSVKYLDEDKYWEGDPEDCLHMSVYSTDLTAKNPVLVFLHGSYLDSGAASDYQPNYLLEKDVVLIVPQFRLGPLGFLSLQTRDVPGNYAIRDVALALQMIQKYVSYFGGDPDNITIIGHTGGAVLAHLLAMLYKDLFHKIILVSSSAVSPWAFDYDSVQNTNTFASFVNCDFLPDTSSCLKNSSSFDLTRVYQYFKEMMIDSTINPIQNRVVKNELDGLINVHPSKYFPDRDNSKPLLAGVTKHAGSDFFLRIWNHFSFIEKKGTTNPGIREAIANGLFRLALKKLEVTQNMGLLASYLQPILFGEDEVKIYNISKYIHEFMDLASIIQIKAPVFRTAKLFAKISPETTFLYTFDYKGDNSHLDDTVPIRDGVTIDDDLQYIFPRIDGTILNSEDKKIAEHMIEMWTSFAANGAPSVPGDVKFPPMTKIVGPYFHVDKFPSIGEDFTTEFNVTTRDAKNGIFLRVDDSQFSMK